MRSLVDLDRGTSRTALLGAAIVITSVALGARDAMTQGAVFSAGIDTVRVDVSVRQGGRAVTGLTAADFEVYDEGVRQQVELVGLERLPVSVVLALDSSGSVQGDRLVQLRAAASRLVSLLEPRDTAALVTFTQRVTTSKGFTADRDATFAALSRAIAGRDTALIDATHAALVLGESAAGRPLILIFSDGADTASFLPPALVLDTARRTAAVVYAVTSGRAEPGGFLDEIVRLTGGRRLDVASLEHVADAFAEALRESRERYLLSYTPAGVRAGGWHGVTVRLAGRRADVRARPGYLAPR